MKRILRRLRPARWLVRLVALALTTILLVSCASIAELGAGATYDQQTGALGGQLTIKLAPPPGYRK